MNPVDNTTLLNVSENLETNDIADPALRLAAFQYLYGKLSEIIAALNSTTAGSSGAESIGSAAISGVTGTTVYAQLANIFAQLQEAAAGTIPNGTVTLAKLSTDIQTAAIGGQIYAYRNLGGF